MPKAQARIQRPATATATATVALLVLALAHAPGQAAGHDEALLGDLSNNGLVPTAVAVMPGSNVVSGDFGRSPVPDVPDLDYFSITVAPGRQARLMLLALNAGGANSFLGVQAGPAFTLAPTATNPSPLLGWAHIYTNQQGSNLLPALGLGSALQAGSYSFWINETDTSQAWHYALDIVVSDVPEPGSAALLLGGLLLWPAGRALRRSARQR